jgi:hypothetical protein
MTTDSPIGSFSPSWAAFRSSLCPVIERLGATGVTTNALRAYWYAHGRTERERIDVLAGKEICLRHGAKEAIGTPIPSETAALLYAWEEATWARAGRVDVFGELIHRMTLVVDVGDGTALEISPPAEPGCGGFHLSDKPSAYVADQSWSVMWTSSPSESANTIRADMPCSEISMQMYTMRTAKQLGLDVPEMDANGQLTHGALRIRAGIHACHYPLGKTVYTKLRTNLFKGAIILEFGLNLISVVRFVSDQMKTAPPCVPLKDYELDYCSDSDRDSIY